MSNIQTILDGCYSDYCSLLEEDAIEIVSMGVIDPLEIEKIFVGILRLSKEFSTQVKAEVGHVVDIVFHNSDGEEVDPQFHRIDKVELHSEGYVEITSTSKYNPDDRFECRFTVATPKENIIEFNH